MITAGNSQPSLTEVHRLHLWFCKVPQCLISGQGENATFSISTPWPQKKGKKSFTLQGRHFVPSLAFHGTEVALCHLPQSLMFWWEVKLFSWETQFFGTAAGTRQCSRIVPDCFYLQQARTESSGMAIWQLVKYTIWCLRQFFSHFNKGPFSLAIQPD